jgi:hypothetical protein
LVSFELANPDNSHSKTVLGWTVENFAKKSGVVDGSRKKKNLYIFEMLFILLYQKQLKWMY